MAAVTILKQPSRDGVCATLANIDFIFQELSSDTVNVIVQCYVYQVGVWQELGGQVRVASNLYTSTIYNFNATGIAALLPKGKLTDLAALGSGDGCNLGVFNTKISGQMTEKSDWKFKLIVQREFLDAATNTIKLDPQTTTSFEFNVWEASPPISNVIYGYWSGTQNTTRYMNPYLMTDNNNQNSGWLWMTDCVLRNKRMITNDGGNITTRWEPMYDVTIKEFEQFYIFCGNGNLRTGITNTNDLVIETYDEQNRFLGQHIFDWNTLIFGGYSNAGRCYFDAGWRTLKNSLNFNVAEGTIGRDVDHYTIKTLVSDSSNVPNKSSSKWYFTIDRECVKKARPLAAYQRFSWKNAMGGFDFFTSDGMLKTERKFKPSRYEKRQEYLGNTTIGKQNYQSSVEYRHKVTTHEMSNLEAEWFSKMLASPQTYIRVETNRNTTSNAIPLITNLIGMDAPSYNDYDISDGLRDAAMCNQYMPIVIDTKSVQISTTKDNSVKIKFTYSYAADNQYLRD